MGNAPVRCFWLPLIAWIAASAAPLPINEGISRFDGYSFTNYGTDYGLPNRSVTSLLVSRCGVYWVGTSAGLFRLDPNAHLPKKLEAVWLGAGGHAQEVNSLLEDRSGSLWVGTRGGFYRLDAGKVEWEPVDVGIPKDHYGRQEVEALLEDRRGRLWVGGVASI